MKRGEFNVQSLAYIEQMYAETQRDPAAMSPEWKNFFATTNGSSNGSTKLQPSFTPRSVFNPVAEASMRSIDTPAGGIPESLGDCLDRLVQNHRLYGHLIAAIDPLGRERPCPPELKLEFYGFSDRELDLVANLPAMHFDEPLTVREIFQRLRDTYCRSIGVQFMHIDNLAVRHWLQRRMERSQNRLELSRHEQLRILTRLTDAVVFEEFLRQKFLGAKTFSLEGCETLLPLIDLVIEKAGQQGVNNIILGMGHRGRLNVLANIIGKSACNIFREFADAEPEEWQGRGDVKYHLGHSGDWTTVTGRGIHLSLCFNPSHLEFVDPVVLGRVRARQDRHKDVERRQTLGFVIHGDAAFAGEGIVQETLNLAKLPGYRVGGALHVVVNNQIGFTTLPEEGRSTIYATDVARMLQSPIFHVNGEDPEAAAQVVQLAMDFRREFQSDVFIDMYGYRRLGHNETDEPTFTQPRLYRAIESRPNVSEGYLEHLLEHGSVSREEADEIARRRREKLESELKAARADNCKTITAPGGIWESYLSGHEPHDEPETGVPTERLSALLHSLCELPNEFHVHPKLERFLKARREMAEGKRMIDWSAAEALALATLAAEGVRIRLTGQDTARGTFSQRHAILYDQETGYPFVPLQHLAKEEARVEIHNSPLSEAAALGFEYGYSLDAPDALILWEAQFGDFVNAAQVILDQFLCSAEDKWQRLSGLVLLLPHGFEGMGPEHSSARLERFLALAAEHNIQVAQPTTPAQYFHVLRRQALRKWRKPLVVFTPKSLLRHAKVVSRLDDFASGCFQRVLPDEAKSGRLRRVLLCTGKMYYELMTYRDENQRDDVAIVRLEQLYPLRVELLENALRPYANGTPVFWIQEEPANMGAWRYLHDRFGKKLLGRFPFALVSRFESASPATGSPGAHKLEQAQVIARAFSDPEPNVDDLVSSQKLAAQAKHPVTSDQSDG
ncbi:MAG TPA: 2-oxoglutarate dehydrogenase E1 component [Verrucomicrobiae bacterium]|nr:2-oxoglutarate dehydrogenase E1 component [Verrucomicrobiae bacterium]